MAKRRPQTIADYAAIGLCPSLIVLLISSLVYFLVLCIYRGGYSGRIGYIWFMFILGAVGIARLSIQESRKYAMLYAVVLGGPTFFVLSSFMIVQGPAAALSPIFNAGMIGLVWFLADRITYDCTLIDEDEDASGRGLLDGLTDDGTGPEQTTEQASKRRRGHQPGRTVLWLAAAALPIFGLGQFVLPQDERWQQSAISALAIYLFATLSLLVTTSFLGVRRYLRQRGVDMPGDVSTAWLAGGVIMTAVMLFVCFLLPQPGKLLANLEVPDAIKSPDWLKPSKYGWGGEAATPEPSSSGAATTPSPEKDSSGKAPPPTEAGQSGEQSSGQGGGQKPGSKSGPGEKGKQGASDQQAGEKSSGEKSPGNQGQGEKGEGSKGDKPDSQAKSDSDAKSDKSNDGEQSQSENEEASPKDDSANEEAEKSDEKSDAEKSKSETPPAAESASEPAAEAPPEPPTDTSSWLDGLLPSISSIFRFLIYLVLFGILVAFAWIQRDEIAKLWAAFLAWLSGRPAPASENANSDSGLDSALTLRPFSSFKNPLGSRTDAREAIIVTYQAAEAWWREKGQARKPDETPHEYSRRLKTKNKSDQEAIVRLTDAYNRVVYGDQSVQPNDLHIAGLVWKSFV